MAGPWGASSVARWAASLRKAKLCGEGSPIATVKANQRAKKEPCHLHPWFESNIIVFFLRYMGMFGSITMVFPGWKHSRRSQNCTLEFFGFQNLGFALSPFPNSSLFVQLLRSPWQRWWLKNKICKRENTCPDIQNHWFLTWRLNTILKWFFQAGSFRSVHRNLGSRQTIFSPRLFFIRIKKLRNSVLENLLKIWGRGPKSQIQKWIPNTFRNFSLHSCGLYFEIWGQTFSTHSKIVNDIFKFTDLLV